LGAARGTIRYREWSRISRTERAFPGTQDER
jgi:hypothetical protein